MFRKEKEVSALEHTLSHFVSFLNCLSETELCAVRGLKPLWSQPLLVFFLV